MLGNFKRVNVVLAIATSVLCGTPLIAAVDMPTGSDKVSKLLGRVVVTPDGELLGRIEDLKIDLTEQKIQFVVISVGSYLIDNNLIAVDPDALGGSADGNYLVVYSDDLEKASRFSGERWPDSADVLPTEDRRAVEVADDLNSDADGEAAESENIVATISDGRRTATMKQGQRPVTTEATGLTSLSAEELQKRQSVQPKKFQGGRVDLKTTAAFDRLDSDGDGYLSRREIASQLDRTKKFSQLDLDGNDGIDAFEFQLLR